MQKLLIFMVVFCLVSQPIAVVQANAVDKSEITPVIAQSGPDSGDNLHPSGKDRSVEPGNSGTQGKAKSDPDGAANAFGGSNNDKQGATGGLDKADQDNNNGCGNDDDFEDDNNGKCLGRLAKAETAPILPKVVPTPTATPAANNQQNANNLQAEANTQSSASNNQGSPSVLGGAITALPFTGSSLNNLGLLLKVLGFVMIQAILLAPKRYLLKYA